jgi:hypothetical protein
MLPVTPLQPKLCIAVPDAEQGPFGIDKLSVPRSSIPDRDRLPGAGELPHPEGQTAQALSRRSVEEGTRAGLPRTNDGAILMLDLLEDLWAFMRVRNILSWLVPLVAVLILGTPLILAQGSVVAPFIYTRT